MFAAVSLALGGCRHLLDSASGGGAKKATATGYDVAAFGWDDSPRFPEKTKEQIVHLNQSPEAFGDFLGSAREYCDRHPDQPELITLYSWNEWVEGAYLLPDKKYGYRYLEAVKRALTEKYEKR